MAKHDSNVILSYEFDLNEAVANVLPLITLIKSLVFSFPLPVWSQTSHSAHVFKYLLYHVT